MPIDEPPDQLRIVDRGGADDDARRARFREGFGRVEVADTSASLDLHREAVRYLTDRFEVRRRPGSRTVEVDDVQPLGAFGDQPARGLEGRPGDLLDGREVATRHADGAALIDVDRGVDDHPRPPGKWRVIMRPPAKLRSPLGPRGPRSGAWSRRSARTSRPGPRPAWGARAHAGSCHRPRSPGHRAA